MKSRNSKIIVLLLLIGLFLTGCGKKEESDTKKPSNDNQNQTDVKNLKIVDANSKSRPYAVMINNISVARPLQSGLQDAYLMYEIIVEGGETRLMALFKGADVDKIGPVRSARHYFIDYAMENDAIYVHFGQSPQAQSDIKKYSIYIPFVTDVPILYMYLISMIPQFIVQSLIFLNKMKSVMFLWYILI